MGLSGTSVPTGVGERTPFGTFVGPFGTFVTPFGSFVGPLGAPCDPLALGPLWSHLGDVPEHGKEYEGDEPDLRLGLRHLVPVHVRQHRQTERLLHVALKGMQYTQSVIRATFENSLFSE